VSDPTTGAVVGDPNGTPKQRAQYRLSKYSLVWIFAALLLVPYELLMIAQGHEGGPLTHVVKWAYGEPLSVRWWLLGWAHSGFLLWLVPHFLFEGFGLRALLTLVGVGFLVGCAGALVTHV
jgi:hypothetical protein